MASASLRVRARARSAGLMGRQFAAIATLELFPAPDRARTAASPLLGSDPSASDRSRRPPCRPRGHRRSTRTRKAVIRRWRLISPLQISGLAVTSTADLQPRSPPRVQHQRHQSNGHRSDVYAVRLHWAMGRGSRWCGVRPRLRAGWQRRPRVFRLSPDDANRRPARLPSRGGAAPNLRRPGD
jgi:hypothetical protein